jgi:biopolymer transport protein ExbB
VLHRYFRSKVAGYVVEMEKQATLLLDDLTLSAQSAAPRARRAPLSGDKASV